MWNFSLQRNVIQPWLTRKENWGTVQCHLPWNLHQLWVSINHVIKNVILDEVHNFKQRSGTISWYEKATAWSWQTRSLLVFYWHLPKKSRFPSGIPDESKQRPHFRLRKVIRNSTKIFKGAKKYFVADDSKDGVEIGHDFDGDDVRKISYSESETTQLDVLHTTLYQLLKEGYSKRDIAVLFSKSDNIPSEERLSAKLNGLSFRSTIDNDSENIVISTVQVQWSGKTSRSTHECIQASVKTPQRFFHLRCSDTCHGKTRHYTIQDTLRGSLRLCM